MIHNSEYGLLQSVHSAFEGRVEGTLVDALNAAARATERQLADDGGHPLHALTDVICATLPFPPLQRRALAMIVDLVQVTIDLVDNLADAEEDRRCGRAFRAELDRIPQPLLQCLPSILSMRAVSLLYDGFPAETYAPSVAAGKLQIILCRMALGQGLTDGSKSKIDRISGEQGTLLCLPYWLAPNSLPDASLGAVEAWARLYGVTWEMRCQAEEARTPAAQIALAQSVIAARKAWPQLTPFREGEPLAWTRLLPPGLPAGRSREGARCS